MSKHTHQCKILPGTDAYDRSKPLRSGVRILCPNVQTHPRYFFPRPSFASVPSTLIGTACHPPDKIFLETFHSSFYFFRCDYRNQLKYGWHCLIPRDQTHFHRMSTVCTVYHNRSECQGIAPVLIKICIQCHRMCLIVIQRWQAPPVPAASHSA